MRVPDEVLGCVVFVGRIITSGSQERRVPSGTAFIVTVPSEQFPDMGYTYLVTARHVAKKLSLGGPWFVRCNLVGDGIREATAADGEGWWYHPTEAETVDAAAHEMPTANELDFRHVPISMFATKDVIRRHDIGPGEVVFLTGLFTKMAGKARNIPLVRLGNIAMMPSEKVSGVRIDNRGVESEVYLVEARSLGGLSGSPVFVRETVYVPITAGTGEGHRKVDAQMPGGFFLLGLMHGHWDIKAEDFNEIQIAPPRADELAVNVGIALVVPAEKIREILYQPALVEGRRQHDRERRAQQGTSTPDSGRERPES
jgi:hypothetical protein